MRDRPRSSRHQFESTRNESWGNGLLIGCTLSERCSWVQSEARRSCARSDSAQSVLLRTFRKSPFCESPFVLANRSSDPPLDSRAPGSPPRRCKIVPYGGGDFCVRSRNHISAKIPSVLRSHAASGSESDRQAHSLNYTYMSGREATFPCVPKIIFSRNFPLFSEITLHPGQIRRRKPIASSVATRVRERRLFRAFQKSGSRKIRHISRKPRASWLPTSRLLSKSGRRARRRTE